MASLHFAGYRGSIGSSYGDGKPSRRFGQQFATAPICSGTRVGSGREIGPRCRGSEIARQCGVAVRQERPLGKPGGLFLLCSPMALRQSFVLIESERFGSRLNQNRAPDSCFDAFCEPVSTPDRVSGQAFARKRYRRAAARWTASYRCCLNGAILSFSSAKISGGAVSGEPALNGGAGLYSRRS